MVWRTNDEAIANNTANYTPDVSSGPVPGKDWFCDYCGKIFTFDYDNIVEHKHGETAACDHCISLGAPWERPEEDRDA